MGPAHLPLPGVQIHLFTFGPQPKMEVHLTPGHLSSHPPSHPFFPALQLTLFLLKSSVPSVPGGRWGMGSNRCPRLSSAGAWPFAPGRLECGTTGSPESHWSLELGVTCPVGQDVPWAGGGRGPPRFKLLPSP